MTSGDVISIKSGSRSVEETLGSFDGALPPLVWVKWTKRDEHAGRT